MRDLGTLGSSSTAVAVADNGRVVGNSALGSGPAEHAFSWTGVGGIVDLGTLGGDNSQAVAVNASGQAVVGSSTTPPSGFPPCPPHAFSWTETAGMVDLGTLGAPGRCPGSGATDVNDSGEVVGSTASAAGAPHAFSWTATGGMVDLGTLFRDPVTGYSYGTSNALAVNDGGQVVGWSQTSTAEHAFSWTAGGGMVDLGTLGGLGSRAVAVNDSGQVVGTSQATDGSNHGFSWTAGGGMIDLGALGPNGEPAAVNESGEVVGTRYGDDGAQHALLWTASGEMVDLGTLGGDQSSAAAIDDGGRIVGWSETAEGSLHAVLWSPATSFASMSASALVVVPPGVGNDTFVLDAAFTVGSSSNGIDPVREPVTLELAGVSLTVPPGSFVERAHTYVFAGRLAGGRLAMTVRPRGVGSYRLDAVGSGYDLGAARLPLAVALTIGDDAGSADAKAVIVPPR